MRVLILAGGFATRLWPLTEHRAKPLVPLAGKPMLSHLVEKIPTNIPLFLSTNACFAKDFEQWASTSFPNRQIQILVEDSQNEAEKKGALSAVAEFLERVPAEDDLCILAGDNYFGMAFQNFLDFFTEKPSFPILAAYDVKSLSEASLFGVVVPKDGEFVQNFEEKPEAPRSTLVSTGAYIFPAKVLPMLSAYAEKARDDLGGIFEHFLSHDLSVRYFAFSETWFDIGSFPAFLDANRFLIGKNVIKGTGNTEENVEYLGSVSLGNNVSLKNVLLEDSIVLSGAVLRNTIVRNSVIGENAVVSGIDLDQKIIRDESYLIDEDAFFPMDGSAPYSGEKEAI